MSMRYKRPCDDKCRRLYINIHEAALVDIRYANYMWTGLLTLSSLVPERCNKAYLTPFPPGDGDGS